MHEAFIGDADIGENFLGEFVPSINIDSNNRSINIEIE